MKNWPGLLKKSTIFMAFALLAGAVMLLFGANASLAQNSAESDLAAEIASPSVAALSTATLPVSDTGLYIVQLTDPAVPSYAGGIAGLEATSPQVTGERRLDAKSPAVQAYVAYLHGKQNEFIAAMEQRFERSVEVVFRYDGAMNGLAVSVSHEEALQLNQLPDVKAVFSDIERELDTDIGPWFLGAPTIWNGDTGSGIATRGEGIIVGIIDTGINPDHPSFAATDGDGYTHTNPYGAGNYNGWCDTAPGAGYCNDKLIGAYGLNPLGGDPTDDNGHGSHTGSTAAGNIHEAVFMVASDTYTRTIAGVAPRANVVGYKVCTPGCPPTASVQAVNHAIMDDEVDVLNFSISGGDNPWNNSVDLAFLEGFNAGIYIAASAGNDGPGPSTVAKTGPWNASTAASTINRVIANTVDATEPTPVPAELQDMAAVPGGGPAILADIEDDIVWAGDLGNTRACNAGGGLPAGSMTGSIGLIQRGDCNFSEKVNNAAGAGAIAVIVYNHVGGPPISMGGLEATTIPAVFIDNASGDDLADFITNNTDPMARINATTALLFNDDWENIVGGFSSRGPSQFEMLAPTFIAPGVNTLAAGDAGPTDYFFSQGTSMSSPHAAGAGALLMALNPTWSPAEVRSALAMTANPDDMLKDDGATPADLFDVGSGLLNLSAAGNIGLVMDETYDNFVDANPDIGGDPKTLNLPAFLNYNCTGECSWTRTVTSVAQDPVTYTAAVDAPAGMTITVEPANFTIDPGASQLLTVTVDVAGMATGDFAFADVQLVPQAGSAAELLNESFTDATFPPDGWATYWLEGAGTQEWSRVEATFNSAPASAHRRWSGSADGFQDDWLVTSPFTATLAGVSLNFADRGQFMGDYVYSGVWASTNSCDPEDGDFVELAEIDDSINVTWRDLPTIDLSAYSGESVCLAFRYSGTFAHSWWVDDVVVQEFELASVPALHMPVAVIPALDVPIITVDPDELSASQAPDTQTSQTLTIGNDGGVDLDWTIAEAPAAMRLGLTLDDANAPAFNEAVGGGSPMSFILDDGVGENAIGVGGAQFLWFNRFTPNSYNFPITIDSVDVMYGYPASTGGINVGELVDIYLYEDEDGDPTNGATHRASLHNQEVEAVDGTTWSSYTLTTPVTFDGPGDILIAVVNRTAGVTPDTFPAVLDQTPPSQQRSWAGYGVVPADPPVFTDFPNFTLIDAFFPGNWMVRGFGTGVLPCDNPADVSWLDASPDMGTTGPDSTTDVTVTFDSTGLATGDYSALLCVESNDPDNPLVEVPVTLTVGETPAIEVAPDSLDSSQPENSQTTHTLEISNVGEGSLDWEIEEAEPEQAVVRNGNPLRLLPDVLPLPGDLMRDYNAFPLVDVIEDGGFEAGSPNPFWDEGSTNFGSPLCTVAVCGTGGGTGPNNGTWWAWFGGIDAAETGFVRQMVTLDAGAAELSFWLEIPSASGTGNDFLEVSLDGSVIFSVTDADAGDYATYTEVVVDVSAFAGGTHELSFDSSVFGGGTTNFFVDDVALDSQPSSSGCLAPTDISWLSVAPTSGSTAAGESDDVTVTLDSTGLDAGVYEALLCVLSNDPSNPLVEVPVTMTVVEGVAYGVELSPATDEAAGEPGEMVHYTLTITNTGEVTDTFTLAASGNDWDVDMPDDVELGAGESTTFTVMVTIPATAADGDMDTVMVTATSTGDPAQSASSELTTTAGVEEYILYLPIIFRQ